MFILSKDGNCIINMEKTSCIYINEGAIKTDFSNGRGTQLGKYNSKRESEIALQIIFKKISDNERLVKMPTAADIQAYIANSGNDKARHISGKKNKGHGGS